METQTKLKINRQNAGKTEILPIKVLQFGEGNFLRAFVDYAFFKLNKEVNFNAGIALVQPLAGGMVDFIDKQDGLYTLFLNGIKNGEKIQEIELIDNVVKCINPYKDFQDFLDVAKLDSLEFVISNTTEAGIEFVDTDVISNESPASFPAKLAIFLYERFNYFKGDSEKGLTIIPCELINYNGDKLKEILLQYADLWKLEAEFKTWISEACSFHNTLVDRIVPGYPRNEIDQYNNKLDYQDDILVTAEPFFLWVIEGGEDLKAKLPFDKINLDVKIVSDMQPYRTRKVRILNGIHTAMVPFSIMFGNKTVQQSMDNEFTGDFIQKLTYDEIVPTLDMDKEDLKNFADEVMDRFRNPFIKHQLSDIALNSIPKFKVRVLPTILDFIKAENKLPLNLVFGFAATIRFYQGSWQNEDLPVKDSQEIVETMREYWSENSIEKAVSQTLSNTEFWDQDLTKVEGLEEAIVFAISEMDQNGIEKGYQNFIAKFS
ncbi:tagaturonate reductase [Halpernia frigidisoli]|uniref:Tagaturonate reductase n=1 Tax=Halpernia frigidisoli TaxID=1125876 RepID=A0A1I3IWE1_9FLAO|nr:tagaturonate reductase [Halpernia frigidisoli]SFI52279.1 tagaturonate reductase [Halpernia frigidisoli]